MRISDRTDNQVVAGVHPLIAEEALRLSGGDKTRVFWVSPFEILIANNTEQWWRWSERAAALVGQ
jgi:hypothetical protein